MSDGYMFQMYLPTVNDDRQLHGLKKWTWLQDECTRLSDELEGSEGPLIMSRGQGFQQRTWFVTKRSHVQLLLDLGARTRQKFGIELIVEYHPVTFEAIKGP